MEKTTLLTKVFLTLVFILTSLTGISQIAQRGGATFITGGGTSLTISKPTGIQVGDIMIANISESHTSNSLTTTATSSGWTLINSRTLGVNNVRGSVLYKIADATDVLATTANYIFSINAGADSSSGAIIAFSGVNTTTPFDVAPLTINPTNVNSITATGITTVTANAAIVMLGQVGDDRSYSGWTTTSPGGLTELYDQINTTGFDTSVGAAWAIKATAGATGNGTATLSGTNRNGAILLALRRQSPPTITSLGTTAGCVGSSITINGTNLTGATAASVRIGGTAVSSITSNSGTVIVAVVGSGTTGTVSVTTPGGTATSVASFTVNAAPTAGLTSNDADNTFCAGTSVTFTATGGTNFNFRVNGTSVQNSASATYTTTTLTNTQVVDVIVTNGCGSTTSSGITNTVNAIPTITSTTPGSRVETGTVTLGATASVGTISWFTVLTGGTAVGTGTSFTTPSISNTTTYYVETSNNGCISTPRTAVIATITRPEINVQGNSTNIGDGDITPQFIDFTDFGESVVGTSISKTFVIQNTGTASLLISSVVLSNLTDFTLTTPPSTTITSGSFSTFVVTFNSATAGLRSATLTLNNNDSNEAVYNFNIQATATVLNAGPEISIEGNSTFIPDGNIGYNTVDLTEFGDNFTGVPTSRNYTIFNTGSTTLNISSLTSSNTTDFSITTAPSITVAPGSSTTFAITFNTATAGIKTTTITIGNDDATGSENPYTFNVRGNGVVPGAAQEIDILGNGNSIPDNSTFTLSSDFTNLGDSFIGSPLVRTYTIKNTGATALTIGAVTRGGTNASEFVVSAISASIAGNSQTTFTITFTPTGAGPRTATISIVNNDGSENPYNFYIEGNGVATAPGVSEIDVQGNKISIINGDSSPSINDLTDFGSTQILTNPEIKTFTIRNYGGSNLILSGAPLVAISGSSDFVLTATPATPIVSLGGTTFSVQFNPSSLGLKTATITIPNNDPNEAPYTFTIQGTGIQTFFDSDGDGVYDNVDVDDDNDGIRDITEEVNCNNSNGNKVNYKFLYETFGTGVRTTINTTYAATTTYGYQDSVTPTNIEGSGLSLDLNDGKYTVGSSAQISSWANQFWYKGTDHTGDAGGRMAIFNASYTPGIFYTALISGALPNVPITYSFWVLNIDRTDAPSIGTRLRPNIRVEFRDINDNVLQSISTGSIAPTTNGNLAGNWIQFTSNLTFSVSTFKVIFINNETGGLGNDLALDDILITQKLCDLDNDGIADMFDLDADNDGIEDVIEAGLGNISNARGKIDVAWADANINGLHDGAETAAALPALDSDGDGIPNYIDLDSDNDSLFDVDESGAGNTNAVTGFVNGDGDITGDGRGDGPESENFRSKDTNGDTIIEGFGDGILDIYDYGTGVTFNAQYGNLNQGIANANPATTYLKDTDADGIPDYLDVMSNGTSFDIANTLLIYDYKTLDTNNDGIIDNPTDIDKDGIADIFDTAVTPPYFGSPRDMRTKLYLDFDGRNDYGQSTAILGGLPNASIMAWIDLNPGFSSEGVIVGQDKFQLRINSSKQLEAVVNSTTLTHNVTLNVSQWYNVGATYDGSNLKLYLNGELVRTQAASGPIVADASLLTLGRNPVNSTKYFKGKIDEVRIFNTALTASQLQRMVHQEIKDFGSEIRGEVVSKNIATSPATLPFSNLLRYYRMDTYKDDIIDDLTTPTVDLTGTKIFNHKNIFVQQAPMPFITVRTGNFDTAINDPSKDIRGLDATDFDYSIIKVKHNITETANNTDLAMFIDSGVTINMTNDTKIQNDWYLKLDGKIDLVGKSQLIQTTESDLDVTSSGSIERDQQGESSKFNYNYWSSPVSSINSTTINHGFTIAGVMKDGTTTTPQNLTWTSGYDGAATNPITISTFWLYKFQNLNNSYANWASVTQNSTLLSGQSYTMKGSAAATASQNYTFVGKPNSGTITSTVSANNLNLCGNPYPSAIDADKFIDDNINSLKGTLYFWEHYNSNTTHNLAEYQGGYATYTKVGGTSPVAPALVSGLGSSSKTPKRFIPVGQGFFVTGSSTGGTILFNNGQRLFVKEDEANSYSLFRNNSNTTTNAAFYNSNDSYTTEEFMKLRLGYNSSNNYHKQILLGFMNQNATAGYDEGYDGLSIESLTNDMYFINGINKLNIQGDGYFNVNNIYPLGVKNATAGNVKFVLVEKENFNQDQEIYIHDNLNNQYHSIKSQDFVINLPAGLTENRFSLRFTNSPSLGTIDNQLQNEITIAHSQSNNVINIKNNSLDLNVKTAVLFNLIGQKIMTWNIDNSTQTNIELPVNNVSTGAYIVKVITDKGDFTKKIIVK